MYFTWTLSQQHLMFVVAFTDIRRIPLRRRMSQNCNSIFVYWLIHILSILTFLHSGAGHVVDFNFWVQKLRCIPAWIYWLFEANLEERVEFAFDYFVAFLEKKVCCLLFSHPLFSVTWKLSNLKINIIFIFVFFKSRRFCALKALSVGQYWTLCRQRKQDTSVSDLHFFPGLHLFILHHRQWKELESGNRRCGNLGPCIDPVHLAPLSSYLSLGRINFSPGYLAGADPK